MPLESGTYISDLDTANPTYLDGVSQGDDHLRLLKSTIKATLPNLTGAVTGTHTQLNNIVARIGNSTTAAEARTALDVYSKSESQSLATNLIDNSNFAINQRGVSGTVTLAAGAYGHDRWKAGASGCTYTFAASGGITTLTISAGSLWQTIEGSNLETVAYTLSQGGTAQMRAVGGTYASSPVAVVSVTGGSNFTIEVGTGTFKQVKLEKGTIATPWVKPNSTHEMARCLDHYTTGVLEFSGNVTSGGSYYAVAYFPTKMRVSPTVVVTDLGAPAGFASTPGSVSAGTGSFDEVRVATGTGVGRFVSTFTASADF